MKYCPNIWSTKEYVTLFEDMQLCTLGIRKHYALLPFERDISITYVLLLVTFLYM